MKIIAIGTILTLIATIFFYFGVVGNLFHALVGLVVVGVIRASYLQLQPMPLPLSGLIRFQEWPLMTLILASIIMVAVLTD